MKGRESTQEGSKVNRRRFIKGLSATAVASSVVEPASATGATGVYARLDDVREEYNSARRVEELLNNYTGLLNALSGDGLIQNPKITGVTLKCAVDYLSSKSGARVWGLSHPTGVAAAHITVRRQTPTGRLTIAYTPEVDKGPRAILKPEIPERGGMPVESIEYEEVNGKVNKTVKRVIPHRPEELRESPEWQLKGGSWTHTSTSDTAVTDTINSTSTVEVQQSLVYMCRMRGESPDCDSSFTCYSWEGGCDGDNDCYLNDCTGNICCGGCCCCCDEDWCCDVCGDYTCESGDTPCGVQGEPDCFESCCDSSGGCNDASCDDCY